MLGIRVTLLCIILCGIVAFPIFVFSQEQKQEQETQGDIDYSNVRVPDTLQEVREESLEVGEEVAGLLPGILSNLWNTRILPAWQNMASFVHKELWQKKIQPVIQYVFDKIMQLLGREAEERKPIIQEELAKEKQELKEEIQEQTKKVRKNLWERFLDLLSKKDS